jgi:hypothetical protein
MPPDQMIRRHIYDRNISIMADKTLLLKNADLLCTMGPRDAASGQSTACLPEMELLRPLAIQVLYRLTLIP